MSQIYNVRGQIQERERAMTTKNKGNKRSHTHQLNTNFILWIWFSKLNTPSESEPIPCSPPTLFLRLDTNNVHFQPKTEKKMRDTNVKWRKKMYPSLYNIFWLWENVYFTCICHFYHFPFFLFMFFISGRTFTTCILLDKNS